MHLSRWIILVAGLLVAGSVTAEVTLTAGMKAGVNFSNTVGSDAGDSQSLTGMAGGGIVAINLSPRFAIQTEILYTQKGSQFDGTLILPFNGDTLTYRGTFTERLPYVELPVLAKFNFVNESDIVPSLYAGPSFAFRASPSFKFEGTVTDTAGTVFAEEFENNIADEIKSFDVNLVVGGTVGIESGDGLVFVDVRYTRGLSSYDDTPAALDLKNSVISVMLGLLF